MTLTRIPFLNVYIVEVFSPKIDKSGKNRINIWMEERDISEL